MSALRRLMIHVLILLGLYQILRFGFWLSNHVQFAQATLPDLSFAFIHGLRFDFATIALINSPFYLLYLLPWPRAWERWGLPLIRMSATLLNTLCLAANISDIEYYKFTGKRVTLDAFGIAHDISHQFLQLAAYYWYLSLLLVFGLVILYRLHRWVFAPRSPLFVGSWALTATVLLVWWGTLGLGIRGGWQPKPLIPAHAFVAASPQLAVLSLNSGFSFLKSSEKESLEDLHLMSEDEMEHILNRHIAEPVSAPRERPKNVVVIILESFGKEYLVPPDGRPSFTPFLEELCTKGSYFPHAFANGRRSIDAVPAIFAGIPSWMSPPFITSAYQTNHIQGLPDILDKAGFRTSFYHGGMNGTMFFDVLAKNLGFQHYLGANEYPNPADNDGQWGIFDEPFLQFVIDDINQKPERFFAGIFTLSSHNPYRVPPAYSGRFPKGTLEIHESLGYADFALRRFFERARQQSWYKDTLFVLTADHTSLSESPLYQTSYGRFAVPLLFIQNDQKIPGLGTDAVAQQSDIMPTVLDLLGLEAEALAPFSQSLWRAQARPGLVLFDAQNYILLTPDSLLRSDLREKLETFDWLKDPLLTQSEPIPLGDDPRSQFLKAQVQFYNRGMIHNRLMRKTKDQGSFGTP